MATTKKKLTVNVNNPQWKVHLPNLLQEILHNNSTWSLLKPLQITGLLVYKLGDIAARINDPELNAMMCRLTIYTIADPESPDYNIEAVNEILEDAKRIEAERKNLESIRKSIKK